MCVLLPLRLSDDLLGLSPLGRVGCRNAVVFSPSGSAFSPCNDAFLAAAPSTATPTTAPSASLVLLASLFGLSTNGGADTTFFERSPPQQPPLAPLASSEHDVDFFLSDEDEDPRVSSLEAAAPAAGGGAALVAAETMFRKPGEDKPVAAPAVLLLPGARTDGLRRWE